MPEPRVKGILPIHLNSYLVAHHGEAGLQQVCAQLSAAAAQMVKSPVAHEWYPHRDFLEAEETITRLLYAGDLSQAWRFGHFNMEESVNRVYRFLFRFLSPELLVQKSAKLWSTLMDQGQLTTESLGPRSIAVQVGGFVPGKPVWCHEMRGGLLGALAVCSIPEAQRRVTETACAFKGAAGCRFEIRW